MDLQKQAWPHMTDYTPSSDLMPAAQRPVPDPVIVDRVVDMIAEAEKPILIAGRGALLSGAGPALEALAAAAGALTRDVAARQGPVRRQSLRARHRRRLRQRLLARALRRGRPGDRRRRGARPLHHRGRLSLSRRAHHPDRHQSARPVAGPAHRRPPCPRRCQGGGRGDPGAPEAARRLAHRLPHQRDGQADRGRLARQQGVPGAAQHARPAQGGARARPGDPEGLGGRGRRRPLLQHGDDPHEGPAGRALSRGQRLRRDRLGAARRHRHRRGARATARCCWSKATAA